MTPADLAALHAKAFTVPRPWSAAEFADFLARDDCFLLTEPSGFLLGRVIADEAELLTLAVAPEARRLGFGRRLVGAFLDRSRRLGAENAFLEVAADNLAATALYQSLGFAIAGRRKAYYACPDGTRTDALVMTLGFGRHTA
jgi:ribosomal-protein-alanine N-acetyltransferase